MRGEYKLNLNVITFEAYRELDKLDKGFVGTPNYLGLAYFWPGGIVKFDLREASISERRRIHARLLKEGVPVGSDLPIMDHRNLTEQDKEVLRAYARVTREVMKKAPWDPVPYYDDDYWPSPAKEVAA